MADWAAIGNLVSQLSGLTARPGSSQSSYATFANDQFRAQQQEQALKEAEKKRKKEARGALGGKIGSTLGTVAGVALAPFTGGASLAIPAALGAAGGAIGGAAGQAIGGGGFSPADTMSYGVQGGMNALRGGMAGRTPENTIAPNTVGLSNAAVAPQGEAPATAARTIMRQGTNSGGFLTPDEARAQGIANPLRQLLQEGIGVSTRPSTNGTPSPFQNIARNTFMAATGMLPQKGQFVTLNGTRYYLTPEQGGY